MSAQGGAVTFSRVPPRRATSRAATWWGRAWVRAVEEAAYADADLHAARQVSRSGAVGAITLDSGRVLARVHDRRGACQVTATVPELDAASSAAFVDVVAAESGHLAALMAGELPHRLVEQAEEAGVELLPYGSELGAACSCTAWVAPCVHALAVLLQVAWLVDADPWVLLRLRGLAPHDLEAAVAAASVPPGEDAPETDDLAVALDAALRAARAIDLSDDPGADVAHLL